MEINIFMFWAKYSK